MPKHTDAFLKIRPSQTTKSRTGNATNWSIATTLSLILATTFSVTKSPNASKRWPVGPNPKPTAVSPMR